MKVQSRPTESLGNALGDGLAAEGGLAAEDGLAAVGLGGTVLDMMDEEADPVTVVAETKVDAAMTRINYYAQYDDMEKCLLAR